MKIENQDLTSLLNLEWLETNGIGGYASSSVVGANTRKYHGLLVAANNPPADKKILIAKVEERVLSKNAYSDLSVNKYVGAVHPTGQQFLKEFNRLPVATWEYGGKGWSLQKKLFMVPGSNTTVLIYENTSKKSFEIEVHPLLVFKNFHAAFSKNDFDFYYEKAGNHIKIHAYPDSMPFFMDWSQGEFLEDRAWYENIKLEKEEYRGQESIEDYYRIGYLKTDLKKGQHLKLVFTTEESFLDKTAHDLEKSKLKHLESLRDKKIQDTFYNDLLISGNQFLIDRKSTNSKSIIAGYHWFMDWGRDSMISMRGLAIATGDKYASKSILSTFTKYLDQGMLPNRFPDEDGQDVEYNTIDATLWLFVALYEYHKKFGDAAYIEENISALENILLAHVRGTRYDIHVTPEGFLWGGEQGWQLTWMDAKVDGYVVTPRIGCPVEINALWYNALCIYEEFCESSYFGVHKEIGGIKERFKSNFADYFLKDEGYLNDVVIPNQDPDKSFRPNQLYAISLPFSILNKAKEKTILAQVGDKLLTHYGLRSLEMDNPEFKGTYAGNQWDRDTAYHQGTVWPFLLMEYWQAYLNVNGSNKETRKAVVKALEPLKNHFYNADCIMGISEIFDGKSPYSGRGCIQQAWSVAALIKLYSEHKLHEIE